MKHLLYTISVLLFAILPLRAQTNHVLQWADTLDASVKTDRRSIMQRQGELIAGVKDIKGVTSPLGEGDPIKWAQSLPGVSTGADGGSAMFVRGSNAGANLSTIDGVPVYGFSHLLGLTTVLPSSLIDEVSLVKSGFHGSETNFTSSHLQIKTKSYVSDKLRTNVNINNFMIGAGMEGKIKDRMYFLAGGRISPLSLEYRLFRNTLGNNSLNDFKAHVGDIYAKTGYEFDENNQLAASVLFSNDSYAFDLRGVDERMGWRNIAGSIRYSRKAAPVGINALLSYTDYLTFQNKGGSEPSKYLYLHSGLGEASLSADMYYNEIEDLSLDWGVKTRLARFRSGLFKESGATPSLLSTVYIQAGYELMNFIDLTGVLRGNHYHDFLTSYSSFDPEFSAVARINILPTLSLELSHDHLVQYYHTLEGLPVGWSLDMIVPSRENAVPEQTDQSAATVMYKKDRHLASIGGFYRHMNNLVYNKHAQNLFSNVMDDWSTGTDIGKGRSYGAEFLYEYSGHDFYSRLSYTWSKTSRYGFATINEGRAFHAKFDREHVLNATVQWKGINISFIYQSGNWENAAAQEYIVHTPEGEKTAQYFTGINNYQMPDIIRIDAGYTHSFKTAGTSHEVSLGICNITNHFNPFMLYYDTGIKEWKMLAILPIMPNFRWRIEF